LTPLLSCALAIALAAALAASDAAGEPSVGGVQMRLEPSDQFLGRADAPLTMVEFTDYQCPFCRRFHAGTWPHLKRDWVDTGKLRFIVRDLPLPFHAAAGPAAEAAHCAGEQGKFWPMHDALLSGDTELGAQGIERRARALGLDMSRFEACVAGQKYAALIAHNAAEADALGLRGTPAFVLGRVTLGQLSGERLEGALPYQEFEAVLAQALARP